MEVGFFFYKLQNIKSPVARSLLNDNNNLAKNSEEYSGHLQLHLTSHFYETFKEFISQFENDILRGFRREKKVVKL